MDCDDLNHNDTAHPVSKSTPSHMGQILQFLLFTQPFVGWNFTGILYWLNALTKHSFIENNSKFNSIEHPSKDALVCKLSPKRSHHYEKGFLVNKSSNGDFGISCTVPGSHRVSGCYCCALSLVSYLCSW